MKHDLRASPQAHSSTTVRSGLRAELERLCGTEITNLFVINVRNVICRRKSSIKLWSGKLKNITPVLTHAADCDAF